MASYEELKKAHKGQSPREAASEFDKNGKPNPNAENLPSFGTVKTPTGPYNPLTNVAYSGDIQGIASGVENIKWGSAQIYKGIEHARGHKASVIGMAKANVFEFPVFISDSVPLEFATATNTLLEQVYASYLQMAISINPVVDHTMIRERQGTSPFAKYKTNTSDYIECVDLTFQKDACHNVIFNDDEGTVFEYNMCSIEDSDARIILEAMDYQPLSEFDHYFMESKIEDEADEAIPEVDVVNGRWVIKIPVFDLDQKGNLIPRDDGNGHALIDEIILFDSHGNVSTDASTAYQDLRDYKNGRNVEITMPDKAKQQVSRSKLKDLTNIANLEKALIDNEEARELRNARQTDVRSRANLSEQEWLASLDTLSQLLGKDVGTLNGKERDAYEQSLRILEKYRKYAADKKTYEQLLNRFKTGGKINSESVEKLKSLIDVDVMSSELAASRRTPQQVKDDKASGNETGTQAEDRRRRTEADNAEAIKELNERKLDAAKKVMNDFIDKDGKVKDTSNLTTDQFQTLLDAIKILDATTKTAADKKTLEQLKADFKDGKKAIPTADLEKLSNMLGIERQLREADKDQLETQIRNEDLRAKQRQNNSYEGIKVPGMDGTTTKERIEALTSAENLAALQRATRSEDAINGYLKQLKDDNNPIIINGTKIESIEDVRAFRMLEEELGKRADGKMAQEKLKDYLAFKQRFKMSPEEFKYELERLKDVRAAKQDEREERKLNYELKRTKAPEFLDENKLKKMNTMKPLMMTVNMSIMADDGHVSHPMEYVVGVKTHCRIIKSSTLPEVVEYPVKEMDKLSRKAKWRAGELKFFKDIMFHIKEKKQTAIDSRDPNRKWYRRLYELAHMKGDGNVSKKIAGAGAVNGLIPNATVIISKSDVDNIENVTKIDMLKASTAINFCEQLFLIGFVVIDQDQQAIKLLIPELNNEYDVMSLGAVNKQIAELDTVGMATRDLFKALR